MTLEIWLLITGLVIALASPIVAWIIFRRERKYRELSYEKIDSLSLLDLDSVSFFGTPIQHRVEIRVDGNRVDSLNVSLVYFRSTGTLSVEYDPNTAGAQTPVLLDFGDTSEIISVETKPSSRISAVKKSKDSNKIVIDKLLLNPGETARVEVILINFEGQVDISGHLRDTKIQERRRDQDTSRDYVQEYFLLALTASSFAVLGVGFGVPLSAYLLTAYNIYLHWWIWIIAGWVCGLPAVVLLVSYSSRIR